MKKLLVFIPLVVILLAVLAACGPYEITYHFDLDYEGAPEIPSITFTNEERPTLPEEPTREGYVFDGWVYGSGKTLHEDDVFYMDITFKAKWLKLCTVSFDANGPANPAAQQVAETRLATEPTGLNNGELALEGWYTDEELTLKFDFTTPISEDITLYAKWVEAYNVTLNYNYDGAPSALELIVLEGNVIAFPANPVREGYMFLAWRQDTGGLVVYDNTQPVTGDITLYAYWVSLT